MYDNKFLPNLSKNLLEILEDNEFYDVTIEVGNDPYVKIFRAHMVILYYRSPYLRRILSTINVNRNNNDGILAHVKLPNILPEIFQLILRYIYGGRLSLEEYDTSDIIEILIASKPKIVVKENSLKNIDSKIITDQHAELISEWIDRLEITDMITNSYEFKLILRGSRDGFSSHKFHKICDGKSHTVSIIKVKDSNEILGGYNPIFWSSTGRYSSTKDSFIFSFKNKENIEDYILSRIKDEVLATFNSSNYDPSFHGLVLIGNNCYDQSFCRNNSSYERPIRKTEYIFSVEEYEIFQIMIK
ncbi:BTB/POZ protein [Rhizophagus clarus]|uniref:BTB/POZ protein n=1 Tax=Rhizophagus clarus TaxID=94130 RepID=A0A8H3LRY9_9GLOM|nr:BTB/POZ protein [Rhizophagus clarus]